jgi:hypothetical protein
MLLRFFIVTLNYYDYNIGNPENTAAIAPAPNRNSYLLSADMANDSINNQFGFLEYRYFV